MLVNDICLHAYVAEFLKWDKFKQFSMEKYKLKVKHAQFNYFFFFFLAFLGLNTCLKITEQDLLLGKQRHFVPSYGIVQYLWN